MRSSAIRVLQGSSCLLPAGALLAACFGAGSSAQSSRDAGLAFDGGLPTESGTGLVDATGDSQGIPAATPSTSVVDFGLVDCGSASSPRTYSITNTGTGTLTYSASITAGGSAFEIQGAASGSIGPGEMGSLSVAASTIPVTSTAGQAITGTLTLATNVPGFASVQVPLKVTPQGGSLSVTPTLAGFGQVQVTTQATPIALAISNVGNAAVDVSVGAPSDAEFSVTFTGAPFAQKIAPGAKLAGAQAGFLPTSAGDKTATAALKTTGAMCATAATSIALAGTGTTALVSIGPDPLDFGTVACGTGGTPASVTIKNGYAFSLDYTTALGQGAASPYHVPPSGSIPASGTATVLVTPTAIPVPGNITPDAYDDTLTITTTAPGASPTIVHLKESATGAILAVAPTSFTFSSVPVNSSVTQTFTVTNSGNAAATLQLTPFGSGFGAEWTNGATAAASGGTASGSVSFTPAGTTAVSGSLAITAESPQCGTPLPAIPLAATVSAPVAGFSNATVAFSAVCGNPAPASQSVSITNTGNATLTISNVKVSDPHFSVVSAPGSIGPSASQSIVVAAAAPVVGTDKPGQVKATLSFTTNELGNPTYTVPLQVAIHGANLALSPSPLAYNGNCYGGSGPNGVNQVPYSITNTGDLPATVTLTGYTPPNGPNGSLGGQTIDFGPGPGGSIAGSVFAAGAKVANGASVTDLIDTWDVSDVCTSKTNTYSYSATGNVCIGATMTLAYTYLYSNGQGGCFCS